MGHESSPIPICWVSREDLIACRPDLADRLEALPDDHLEQLASQLGDALQETCWLTIAVALESLAQEATP